MTMGKSKVIDTFTKNKPSLRENQGKVGSRTITGYAIVFNKQSEILVDWCDKYREVISPSAISSLDFLNWDIKMTMFHDREKLLARSNKGHGTLKIQKDNVGIKYTFEAPETPDGNTAIELVKRGDIQGASFAFVADESKDTYTKDSEGTVIRTVNKIDLILDFTLASDPAYPQTSAGLRERKKVQPKEPVPGGVREILMKRKKDLEEARKYLRDSMKYPY